MLEVKPHLLCRCGVYGMPLAQAFLGSYDLDWQLLGYDEDPHDIR